MSKLKQRADAIRIIENVLRNHYDYPATTIMMHLEDNGFVKFEDKQPEIEIHPDGVKEVD